MKRVWKRRCAAALAALFACLAGLPGAWAQGDGALAYQQVELYQCGQLPVEGLSRARTRSAANYESDVLAQLEAQAEWIDVSAYGLTPQEHAARYRALINAHPELFYVSNGYRYLPGEIMTRVYPIYLYSGEELAWRQAAYAAELDKIAAYASRADTQLGKALLVNDYFCIRFQYDTGSDPEALIYNAGDLFAQKKGVCQAYMLGYRAAMNRLGITSASVISTQMNHAWNLVYLDGAWYHVDVTWNDPAAEVPLRANHTYFLLSDAAIAGRGHYAWEAPASAAATNYDGFFWQDIHSPICVDGDTLYYVRPAAQAELELRAWTEDAGEQVLMAFDARTQEGGGSYRAGYNVVYAYQGRLYYATCDQIRSVKTDGSDDLAVFDPQGAWRYIWTGYGEGDELRFFVASAPGAAGRVWTLELSGLSAILLEERAFVEAGALRPMDVVSLPEGQELTWQSAAQSVAVVDAAGVVTAVAPGETVISASSARGARAECPVVVYQAGLDMRAAWLLPGERLALGVRALPESVREGGWTYATSDAGVAAVDNQGVVSAVAAGNAAITATSALWPEIELSLQVFVGPMDTLALPAQLTQIGTEAFAGGAFARVEAGAALESIGARAFAGCRNLRVAALGASVTFIAEDAFEGCEDLLILCPAGSPAALYAEARGIPWREAQGAD